jgi:hypothetical protein
LISGGVFLIDRAGEPTYQSGSALVPFFIRDFNAKVDAGRLTTAAGRMDKLDLLDVCVSEHTEEMVFFGQTAGSEQTRILVCAPSEWRPIAKESTLGRLIDKHIAVPGIDPKQIAIERKRKTGLIAEPETLSLCPPSERSWGIRIFYRDSAIEKWELRHEYRNFVLIPDQKSATLEFRVIWLTSLTSETIDEGPPQVNNEIAALGRLLGIVDGDGYSRTAMLVKAQDFIEYVSQMRSRSIDETLFSSDTEDGAALRIEASTDGRTGRLSSFRRRLPVAPLTTSVSALAALLRCDLKLDGGT